MHWRHSKHQGSPCAYSGGLICTCTVVSVRSKLCNHGFIRVRYSPLVQLVFNLRSQNCPFKRGGLKKTFFSWQFWSTGKIILNLCPMFDSGEILYLWSKPQEICCARARTAGLQLSCCKIMAWVFTSLFNIVFY